MKRSKVTLADVTSWDNLTAAFGKAARAARSRREVERFATNLEAELLTLRAGLLSGERPFGRFNEFRIRDPKPRVIHAPCFADRVLHHALIAVASPVLDRALAATKTQRSPACQ